jgi:hypothetical protein
MILIHLRDIKYRPWRSAKKEFSYKTKSASQQAIKGVLILHDKNAIEGRKLRKETKDQRKSEKKYLLILLNK